MKLSDKKITIKGVWKILKQSFTGFSDDNVMNMSGSLAYATIFSFAPFLIVLLGLAGWFLGEDAVEGRMFDTLNNYLSRNTSEFIQTIVQNASVSGKSELATWIGIATLLFSATTVFAQIQTSINTIWSIKPKPKKSWLKMIMNRLLSFSMILSLGFLLLVFFGVNTLIDAFSDRLMGWYPDIAKVIFYIINLILTISIITLIFAAIFKFLPDAKIRWKDVWVGSLTTAILFTIGRYLITIYVNNSNFESTYGAAASFVVLLVWIYYSSVILYFGAEFTKSWAIEYGKKIFPTEYAVSTKIVEVESEKKPVESINKTEVKDDEVKNKKVDLKKKIDEDFSDKIDKPKES